MEFEQDKVVIDHAQKSILFISVLRCMNLTKIFTNGEVFLTLFYIYIFFPPIC